MPAEYRDLRIREIAERITPFVLLALLIWMARYWDFRSFGLYEDDYFRIPKAMGMTAGEDLAQIARSLLHFGDQGRPLHPALIYVFSSLGFRIGGLAGIYLIGYVIVVGNAFLFYLLLKRLSNRPEVALLGGLAFGLFPADTTQAFLTHSLGLQPSLTVLLIAFHLYLSGRVKSSYAVIFCTLLIYETVFPVFLVAPLLQRTWNPQEKRRFFQHALVLGAMLVLVGTLRVAAGEARVAGFGLLQAFLLLANPLIGPIASMAMFIYRPIETLIGLDEWDIAIVLVAFIGIAAALFRLRVEYRERELEANPDRQFLPAWISEFFQGSGRLFVVGLFMLVLAYPLTLTTVGFAISGRGTRAHTAAVLGASTVFACLASAMIRLATARGKRYIAYVVCSAWLAMLVGFGLTVQRDYKLAWNFQRSFWTDVIRLCPDLEDGTVVFVDPSGLPDNRPFLFLRKQPEGVPDSRQIKFLEDAHMTLPEIYDFPVSWKNPPILYRLPVNWREQVHSDDSMPPIDAATAGEARNSIQTVASANAILLETSNGSLSRKSGPILVAGHKLILKDGSVCCSAVFRRGPLYKYLIAGIEAAPDRFVY